MESIIIHPNNKQQIKVFEEMAIALQIPYEVEQENETESEFAKEFREAQKTGFTIEESRKRTLDYVNKLWNK